MTELQWLSNFVEDSFSAEGELKTLQLRVHRLWRETADTRVLVLHRHATMVRFR
ncbi:hypothetical protein LR48_Vigan10g190200 [Vigna angularis]|uniref:Uncharacterized protein n=1 Tax=Phaseolus angularis TaxID=3914 RepID=A0A0L9VLU6_PHAAN|nr:hypothetical protein LR48_Vigan10g190200 [Vigna angularis]